MRLTERLQEALKEAGYSDLPMIFKTVGESGNHYDRSTNITQHFLDDAFTPQVMAVIHAVERSPWPENHGEVVVYDENGSEIRTFA